MQVEDFTTWWNATFPDRAGDSFDPAVLAAEARLRLVEEVDALPPMREYYRTVYLDGGWHRYSKRPPEVEPYREADGTDVNGRTIYRTRLRDLEIGWSWSEGWEKTRVPVDESSREATLSLIREMRRSGWSHEQAERMMGRDTLSTKWLRTRKDPAVEFARCWEKAAVPVSELSQRRWTDKQGVGAFVSHPSDQRAVWAFIAEHPGMGRNELLRSKCGMTGQHIEGRIKAALTILRDAGRVHTEPGPRSAVYHFAICLL